ncbi:uncharacterized protein LOC135493321 isoform X2 [Lineus longissimus]
MGTSQCSASLQRFSHGSSCGSQSSNESESLESAFFKAKKDMLLLVQDELILKKDIQDVQSLFSKIMSQLDELDSNRHNNYSTEASSVEYSQTYAKTNLNRNHQARTMKLGLGLPPLQLNKYCIPLSQSSRFHDEESSYTQTESSLYPSDCAKSDSDYSQTSSASSRQGRNRSRKTSKRVMNKTYVIEPATEKQAEPSILDKSTFFDQTSLRSYNGFMPVLSSTFAGNLTQHTNIEPCGDDAEEQLTSAVTLNRHLRNKQNVSQNEKSMLNNTARQNLRQKGILKNSSYYHACSTSVEIPYPDRVNTDSPRNDDGCDVSLATDTTLGTRPSPLGAYSYELTQINTTPRRQTKVRFEDVSSTSDSSCASCSSQTNSCDHDEKPRVKRFSKKPPTPMKYGARKPTDSSSDSEREQFRKKPIRRQVSFADSVPHDCLTPSDIGSAYSCDSDTSLWLENSNEVFVDYETERQARRAAMDSTQMVQIEESTQSVASEDNRDEPVLKLPWLPQLAFDITEDSFKATLKELENVENYPNVDHNMTYNDNFALIAHIEKEFKKCQDDGSEVHSDQLNVSRHYALSEDDHVDVVEVPLNVSLNDSFPKHQKCVDHDVHLALGEPCSFYLEDTLTMLENSKLFELHMDQLSESGFESTHTLNSSVDSSQADTSSIDSASQKQSLKPNTDNKPKCSLPVPMSLEVTRESIPDITSVQTPEDTTCDYEDNRHTMCEMNFQGAPQRDYCESVTSSANSSSSGMGSHNSSQSSYTAIQVHPVLYNTPVTSAEPTPDSSVHDSSKLIAPYATPASTCTSISEESTAITILNPPQSQMLFNLGISPISSKDSCVQSPVAVPMNSPCVSEDEDETLMNPVIVNSDNSPQNIRKQLFPSPDGPPSPIVLPTKRKLTRGNIFKIVQRSNSKIRGKKSSSESDDKLSNDRHTVYKKKKDIKKKLKVFSSLFHRKDKDSINQIKTLAHI